MTKRTLLSLFVPFLLGLGIISSFFREIVIAYYYGSSKEVEIYRIAFSIPYALFQSLGTILIASLLPLYLADRNILPNIQSSIKKVFLFVILIAILTIPWQSVLFAPGFTQTEQSALMSNMLISWSIVLIAALIFPMRLILQSNDKKILVSATSLFFSFFLVSMIILLHKKIPGFELTIASVISIIGIYIVYKWNVDLNTPLSKSLTHTKQHHTITKIIIGSFIYILLLSMPRMIDKAIASQMGDGVVANLDYAMNFYVAFGVLIGTSFTIIYAKKIAHEYKANSMHTKWIFQLIGIPFILASLVSLIIYPYSEDIVSLAYARGAFSISDTMQVTAILHSFLIALPLMVVGMLLSQIVAAYSILVLIGLVCFKILSKWIWIELDLSTIELSVFGESTLIMEFSGIIAILFILRSYSRSKGS